MKATKIAALVLSVLMAVGCCACSQKPGGASSGTSAPPSGAQSSGTESQIDLSAHRDIVMWMVSSPPSGLEDVLSAINEKLEADFNATLHYNLLGFDSEMMTKYGLLLAGNEQVDIIQGSSVFFSTYVSQGAYSALDDPFEPKLDLDRLRELREALDLPLILHGGTGIPAEQVKAAIRIGVTKVNVGTSYGAAFYDAMKKVVDEGKITNYVPAKSVMKEVVIDFVRHWIQIVKAQ